MILTNFWKTITLFIITLYLFFFKVPSGPAVDIPGIDKVAHFVVFFGTTFSLLFDLSKQNLLSIRWIIATLLLNTVYGGGVELIQMYLIEYRTGSWLDFWMDFAGVVYGGFIFFELRKYKLFAFLNAKK